MPRVADGSVGAMCGKMQNHHSEAVLRVKDPWLRRGVGDNQQGGCF